MRSVLLLLLFMLPFSIVAEKIDRISSAQEIADRYVFAAATGGGPWTLQVGILLKAGDKPVASSDLQISVFDASGNKLLTHSMFPETKAMMEIRGGMGARQAGNAYTVESNLKGSEPVRVEITLYGKKAVLELKDRPSKY